jgi:hypothetical protein
MINCDCVPEKKTLATFQRRHLAVASISLFNFEEKKIREKAGPDLQRFF